MQRADNRRRCALPSAQQCQNEHKLYGKRLVQARVRLASACAADTMSAVNCSFRVVSTQVFPTCTLSQRFFWRLAVAFQLSGPG
eukprot:1561776-Prymnesium_polylepis.2